jgi:hypothetical protein
MKKHKSGHASLRDHPDGTKHGKAEAGIAANAGLRSDPHGHKPMGVGEMERTRHHPEHLMGGHYHHKGKK